MWSLRRLHQRIDQIFTSGCQAEKSKYLAKGRREKMGLVVNIEMPVAKGSSLAYSISEQASKDSHYPEKSLNAGRLQE